MLLYARWRDKNNWGKAQESQYVQHGQSWSRGKLGAAKRVVILMHVTFYEIRTEQGESWRSLEHVVTFVCILAFGLNSAGSG